MDFYLAKLNFEQTLFSNSNLSYKDIIVKSLKSISNKTTYRNGNYIIIEVVDKIPSNANLVYGKLVKYADISESTVNADKGETEQILVEDKIIASCHFVIDLEENNLAYTIVKNHINNKSFIERFNSLISKEESNYIIYANPINEIYDFRQRLAALKSISEIELTIRPTNPSPMEIIQGVDGALKRENLKEKKIVYKGKESGIIVDEEIETNSVYVDIGYGRGKATGYNKSGAFEKIFSHKSEKQKRITSGDIRNMSGLEIAEQINNIIKQL